MKTILRVWAALCFLFAAFYIGLSLYASASPSTTFTPGSTGLGEWIGMGLLSLAAAQILDHLKP